jgi:hypothetical protein
MYVDRDTRGERWARRSLSPEQLRQGAMACVKTNGFCQHNVRNPVATGTKDE